MPLTNFFWEPLSDNILQERDELGALTAEYTTEPGLYGNVISQSRDGVESQFHFDAVGSTLALTDNSQQLTDTRAYSAFGETIESSGGTTLALQYVGQKGYYLSLLTAQYSVRRRAYDPMRSRWTTTDPLNASIAYASTYSYANNLPCGTFDPSGLLCYSSSLSSSHTECKIPSGQDSVGFRWEIEWREVPKGANGFILQHITRTTVVTSCTTGLSSRSRRCELEQNPLDPKDVPRFPEPLSYWELWFVRDGTIYIGVKTVTIEYPGDAWSRQGLEDTYGWDDMRGSAYFVPTAKDPLDAEPPGGWEIWHLHEFSGSVLSTCKTLALKKERPFASRRLLASWCCCNCPCASGQEQGITLAILDYWGKCK